jgi:hypothetical protein
MPGALPGPYREQFGFPSVVHLARTRVRFSAGPRRGGPPVGPATH